MSDAPQDRPLVGIVPAAGAGTRLAGHIVGSKEALSIRHIDAELSGHRPAIGWTLAGLAVARASRAVLVVREGKWDVVEAAGKEARSRYGGPSVETLVLGGSTPSSAHTLQAALADPELSSPGSADVALCYPDILLSPPDALRKLRRSLRPSRSGDHFAAPDVVLGCFPAPDPARTDMVEIDADGRLVRMVIKRQRAVDSAGAPLRFTWQTAVWKAGFSRWFVDQVATLEEERRRAVARGQGAMAADPELHVGRLIERSTAHGFDVRCVVFERGRTLDVGTPDALAAVDGLGASLR